jgi:hypothetical protein
MARGNRGNNPGWQGDSEGHSQAARKGWRTRKGGSGGRE